MKLLLPLFLALACGKTHSTSKDRDKDDPIVKNLNLKNESLHPIELVYLVQSENYLHPVSIKNLDLKYKIKCTKLCNVTRRKP